MLRVLEHHDCQSGGRKGVCITSVPESHVHPDAAPPTLCLSSSSWNCCAQKVLPLTIPHLPTRRRQVVTAASRLPSKCMHACSAAKPCPTLCNPMGCSPPGSPVHGIFQARILEWVAISSSRESSQPKDQTHVSCTSCISRRIL